MAENIVAGLFGLTPEMYGERQRTSALQEGITLAQLDPASRGAAMTYSGANQFGNALGSVINAAAIFDQCMYQAGYRKQ